MLTLVCDGRVVYRLGPLKSRASVFTSGIAAIGSSLSFLGSQLGDSLLVQFTSIPSSSVEKKVGNIEGDVPSAKRSRRSSSDALQDMVNGDKLPLYGLAPNSTETSQKTFSFSVSDSLINVGPLKDFYGLRINADLKATGIVKQSNYELMCCSGHGKNGALCILQQSIRPEGITEVELPGCKRIWTVYHKNTRGHKADSTKMVTKDDEYCAYLIISPESRTMVLETVELLDENDFALSVAMDLAASVSAIEQTSRAASVSFMRKFLYKISGQELAIMGILKMLRSLECAV